MTQRSEWIRAGSLAAQLKLERCFSRRPTRPRGDQRRTSHTKTLQISDLGIQAFFQQQRRIAQAEI
jgi:hypothetical protein